jgi:predicted nucleic acid-binding protein
VIVLDTIVVSELMRPVPNPAVLAWVDAQSDRDLWLCSVVVSELLYGLARLPTGSRRAQLTQAFEAMLAEDFAGRVLAFDLPAAVVYADLVSARKQLGKPLAMADAQIAATCLAHGAQLATRNVRDFEGLGLGWMNPWTT